MSVNSITRLGRKPLGEGAKPRPLKVVLASEDQKERVLRVAKNLKRSGVNGLERVFIHQDLTPKQRQKRKALVEEMKVRQGQGEQNLIIVKDKIVQRRLPGAQSQQSG